MPVARWVPLAPKARLARPAPKVPLAPKDPKAQLVKGAAALRRLLAIGPASRGRPEAPRLITGGSR